MLNLIKYLFIIHLIFFTNVVFAQTKLIAFKSHSGNMENFKNAYEENLFDLPNDNFGAAPNRWVNEAALDSLIYINDTAVIMVTSNYCMSEFSINYKNWGPGKDTVYNHPLFCKKHSLDSIKEVLKTSYNFANSMDTVKFIGYDNLKKVKSKRKQKGFINVFFFNNNSNNFNLPSIFISIFLASIVFVLFTQKLKKRLNY